jgi:hypothetical protein
MTSAIGVEEFLLRFFGDGNEISVSVREAPRLATWLDGRLTALRRQPGATHILPRRQAGRTYWYAIAQSPRELMSFKEALEAFVGSTYAVISRRPRLDMHDPVEAAVAEFSGGQALVLEVVGGAQQEVRDGLDLLAELEAARPVREVALARPLGRLLREFEMAIVAGLAEESRSLLDELERSGQLSAQNELFLRIRRLAGLQRFEELLAQPELGTLLLIRRPAKVSADVLRAVYATEIASFEDAGDVAGARWHFEVAVLPRYPALFKSRQGLQTPEAIKAFMLYELVANPDARQSRLELLTLPDLSAQDRAFLRALDALGHGAEERAETLETAVEAIRCGNFERALAIARSCPPSTERAELMLRAGVEVDSLEALRLAKAAVDDLERAERDAIISSRWYSGPWEHVVLSLTGGAEIAAPPITSWAGWFRGVAAGMGASTALPLAERGVVEWSIEEFVKGGEGAAVRGILNQEIDASAMRTMRDALPHFLQFLDRSDESAQFRDLLDDVLVLLLTEESLGVPDLQVIVNICATVIELGVPRARYAELVADIRDAWQRSDAPSHLDAALEMLDVLLMCPCPDTSARDLFFQALVGSFQRWRRRVRDDQWLLLEGLADELHAADVVAQIRPVEGLGDEEAAAAPLRTLAGKTVAIYTLTEPAAARASSMITRLFPGVVVEASHDHVGTDRLRSLARTADVFLVAARSAKHAATTYIDANRPSVLPTVYAAGRGSASLVRALYAFVLNEGEVPQKVTKGPPSNAGAWTS